MGGNNSNSDVRLAKMILLLCERPVAKAVMNRLLFFVDYIAWNRTGRSVSGADFSRMAQGAICNTDRRTSELLSLAESPERGVKLGVRSDSFVGQIIRVVDAPGASVREAEQTFERDHLEIIHMVRKAFHDAPAAFMAAVNYALHDCLAHKIYRKINEDLHDLEAFMRRHIAPVSRLHALAA